MTDKPQWDTTPDMFGDGHHDHTPDVPDDGQPDPISDDINSPEQLLGYAEQVQPDDARHINHAIFNNIAHPDIPLYFDFNQPCIGGIQYHAPLFLPLMDAQGNLKQIAVLEPGKRTIITPEHKPRAFAQIGSLSKDQPIMIAYDLDTAFRLSRCGYAVALAVFSEVLDCNIKTELNEVQCNLVKSVCGQLSKAGYQQLYIVSYPATYPKVHNALVDALAAYNVRFIPTELHLSFMDPHEIQKMIDDAIHNEKVIKHIPKGHLAHPMQFDNGTFEILPTGVWYSKRNKGGDERTTFISSPVLVLAKTRDDSSNGWGRLLQWDDDAGVTHQWAISMQHFQTDGAELRKALADQGVTIAVGGFERTLFQTYLASYPVDQFALCVDRVGWYEDQYVLPHEVIGQNANGEIVVYQSGHGAINKYASKATLQDWQQHISTRAQGHKFLVLALCAAFAGQLLEPLNLQGMGIHYKGKSSKGKSTAVFVASTVWGNPEGYHHTWRSTGNAMERTAFTHNHGLLALDEIGEIANPREAGNIIYMLTHGHGKNRMSGKTLELKEPSRWKLVFISSGEKTLSEVMGEVGQKTKLGQEIRFINIDIDDSQYGIFDCIDFAEDAAKQAVLLNSDIKRFYGTAGAVWLDYLTQDKAKHTAHAKALIDQYSKALTGSHSQGHIVRVANYFALVAAAGEMATQAGITTWQHGIAFNAVQAVFNHWIGDFEQVGDYEDREILAHVKAFFAMHGSSRFEHIEQNVLRNAAGDDISPRIHNRVGYWKQDKDGKKYLVYPELFKSEICKGYDHKRVAKVLKVHGWLDTGENGRTEKKQRVPDNDSSIRMVTFNHYMWEWEQEADSHISSGNTGNSGNNVDLIDKKSVPTIKSVLGTSQKVGTVNNDVPSCSQSINNNGNSENSSKIRDVPSVPNVPTNKTTTSEKRKSKQQQIDQSESRQYGFEDI